MKQKLLWILFGSLTFVGLVVALYFGIQPRPVEKIRFSAFESPAVAAKSILMRLRQELMTQNTLFLGLDPAVEAHWQVLSEFITQNTEPQLRYDTILVDKGLGSNSLLAGNIQSFDFSEEPEKLLQFITQVKQANSRILIIMPAVFTLQHVPNSLANIITQKYKISGTSLLFVNVPRRRDDESKATIPCQVADGDRDGSGRIGCLIQQKARSLYYKKISQGKLVGYLDQIGGAEYYLALTIEPIIQN